MKVIVIEGEDSISYELPAHKLGEEIKIFLKEVSQLRVEESLAALREIKDIIETFRESC